MQILIRDICKCKHDIKEHTDAPNFKICLLCSCVNFEFANRIKQKIYSKYECLECGRNKADHPLQSCVRFIPSKINIDRLIKR